MLRRFKGGGRPDREAAVMELARRHGFPVPEVLKVLHDGLVLERVDRPTMLTELRLRPWRASRAARTLAEPHTRLHEIPFEDARLLRLDLHPDNVLVSPCRPIVFYFTTGAPTREVAAMLDSIALPPNVGGAVLVGSVVAYPMPKVLNLAVLALRGATGAGEVEYRSSVDKTTRGRSWSRPTTKDEVMHALS